MVSFSPHHWSILTWSRPGSTLYTTRNTSEECEVETRKSKADHVQKYLFIFLDDLDSITLEMNFRIPQYLLCNKKRFPYWFGELDQRNQQFHQMIRSFQLHVNLKNLTLQKNCDALFPNKKLYVNDNQYRTVRSC